MMNVIKFADLELLSSDAIREIEQKHTIDYPHINLMKKAGKATANLARQLINSSSHPILVLAGPGNNGGDACGAAADLAKNGYKVIVVLCADTDNYSPQGKKQFEKALARKVIFKNADDIKIILKVQYSLVIDGLFGIGLTRPISGSIKELIHCVNDYSRRMQVRILSIDVPSGLNPDTGIVISNDNEEGIAICAHTTITFLANKPGLYTADGKDFAGNIVACDLDTPTANRPAPLALLNHAPSFKFCLAPRKQNSNKGSFGNVVVIGGAKGMIGAGVLAARSALFAGAGKVILWLLDQSISYDPHHPEIMYMDQADTELDKAIVVIGPGIGNSERAKHILNMALLSDATLVIDADALNLIAEDKDLQTNLISRTSASVLTPHPLEAARLLNQTTRQIQSDRLIAASTLAKKFNSVVILKGSGSIICNQVGDLRINKTGNPGLATGGTGDVLAGLCGSLIAQGLSTFDCAQLATWAHGAAADELVKHGIGPIGLNASELPEAIRHCLNTFVASQNTPD